MLMSAHGEGGEGGGRQRGRQDGAKQRGTESSNLRRLQIAGEERRSLRELPQQGGSPRKAAAWYCFILKRRTIISLYIYVHQSDANAAERPQINGELRKTNISQGRTQINDSISMQNATNVRYMIYNISIYVI